MLRIYSVALEVVRELGVIARDIARHDAGLARQIRRAVTSVPLNLAEGSGEAGGSRTRHYRIALGSMRETLAGVQAAMALGYVSSVDERVLGRIQHVSAVLYKLTRG